MGVPIFVVALTGPPAAQNIMPALYQPNRYAYRQQYPQQFQVIEPERPPSLEVQVGSPPNFGDFSDDEEWPGPMEEAAGPVVNAWPEPSQQEPANGYVMPIYQIDDSNQGWPRADRRWVPDRLPVVGRKSARLTLPTTELQARQMKLASWGLKWDEAINYGDYLHVHLHFWQNPSQGELPGGAIGVSRTQPSNGRRKVSIS